MQGGSRRPRAALIDGREQDVIAGNGRYRRYYAFLDRAGAAAYSKRKVRRRERAQGRAQLRHDPENA